MAKPTYWEQLKDPRWQRKRLEILERSDFKCEWCGDAETTLHVHHTMYRKSTAPWDYPDRTLLALCEVCHGYAHSRRGDIDILVSFLMSSTPSAVGRLIGYAHGLTVEMKLRANPQQDDGFRWMPVYGDPGEAEGLADYFRVSPSDIEVAASADHGIDYLSFVSRRIEDIQGQVR